MLSAGKHEGKMKEYNDELLLKMELTHLMTLYRKVEHEPLASQKNSHRISRVRDNLSESITGFSPHNISEHVVS